MTTFDARLGLAALFFTFITGAEAPRDPLFTDQDRAAVQAFWNTPGRLVATFASEDLPFQPRQTAEGSRWLFDFGKKIKGANAKLVPGQDLDAADPQQKAWNAWIDAKYAYDEYRAAVDANIQNQSLGSPAAPDPKAVSDPGPCPQGIIDLVGAPPEFARAMIVRRYTIDFGDLLVNMQDNVKVRRKYAYYRFPSGVMDAGQKVSAIDPERVKDLFAKAKVDGSLFRIMSAVSALEGGFDSINTYDTGYVSVGFLQFACLSGGAGSLGRALQIEKADNLETYQSDFRRYGVDVTDDGTLDVLDPNTGDELVGNEAALKIIADKRLTAVFLRAGRLSEAFRVAQIKTAVAQYFPADDPITVQVGDQTYTGKVSDVIKSEAGLATLMDRKVNTGSLGDLQRAIAGVMLTYNLKSLKEASGMELEIVQAMQYRKSYLGANDLSQPKPSSKTLARGTATTTPDKPSKK